MTLPSDHGGDWIPISLPPPRFETVEVQLADGCIATALYTGAEWYVCGAEDRPRFWRPHSSPAPHPASQLAPQSA